MPKNEGKIMDCPKCKKGKVTLMEGQKKTQLGCLNYICNTCKETFSEDSTSRKIRVAKYYRN